MICGCCSAARHVSHRERCASSRWSKCVGDQDLDRAPVCGTSHGLAYADGYEQG